MLKPDVLSLLDGPNLVKQLLSDMLSVIQGLFGISANLATNFSFLQAPEFFVFLPFLCICSVILSSMITVPYVTLL